MKYLIVWGCDPISSNRQVPNAIGKLNNILTTGTVVAVDPRMSNTAAKAHKWLPVKPSEDGALALAMAHVILTSGMWYKEFVGDFKDGKNHFVAGKEVAEADFVEKHTNGLVRWWNIELKDKTPQWAAARLRYSRRHHHRGGHRLCRRRAPTAVSGTARPCSPAAAMRCSACMP
jgi:anaerobic selenocysteine-containing dehydrogenase